MIINKTKRQDENLSLKSSKFTTGLEKILGDQILMDISGRPCPMIVSEISRRIKEARYESATQAQMKIPITRAIKSISLSPSMWNQFEYWYRTLLSEHQADAEVKNITFLDVVIQKGSSLQLGNLLVEYHK